jgi:hypothetical protein
METTHELVLSMNPQESLLFAFIIDEIYTDLSIGETQALIHSIKDYCEDYKKKKLVVSE